MPKIPKLKIKVLIISALGFGFVAYFGIWGSLATVFAIWAAARVVGAIFRFTGRFVAGVWSLSNYRGRFADNPLLNRDIKTIFK